MSSGAGLRKLLLFPALTLAAGAALAAGSFFLVRENVDTEAELRFERQASDAKHFIEARFNAYFEVLRGLAALFARPEAVSQAEFHRYVGALDLPRRYPGFVALNYADYVPHAARAAFEARVRGDSSLEPAGYPGFGIQPAGERAEYLVVSHVSPMETFQATLGVDLLFSPRGSLKDRIEATDASRDNGTMTSSGRFVKLPDGRSALPMRLPAYRAAEAPPRTVEERRARYIGSVGAGFQLRQLMQGALEESSLSEMRFKFYDAGPAQRYAAGAGAADEQRLLFDSGILAQAGGADGPTKAADTSVRKMLPMEVAGRIWEIHFSAPRDALVKGIDRSLPVLVLGAGLLASLFLSAMLYSLGASRSRAEQLAAGMHFAATHDALTGLANRASFHGQLEHALARAARQRRGVAVLFIDLDRFKLVNDTLGHEAGDRMLRECARRLRECLRDSDIVARQGGDEFVVMMEDVPGERAAATVAQKILVRIGAPLTLEGSEIVPSASIGIGIFPQDGTDVESLLRSADTAMYRAKERGRNNYQLHSADGGRNTATP